jgi:hypothetical protein
MAEDNTQTADSTGRDSRQELIEQLPDGFFDSTSSILPVQQERKSKSPAGALLRSLALPGWGQFYTEHPVRGTITALAETAFISVMIIELRDRADLRDRLARLERENGSQWPADDPLRVELNNQIKSARRKAGDYMAYGATALLLGMLDSYVSAHLYNFDRHFALAPADGGRLCFSVKF